jgi:hypothetical protein
MGGPTIKFPIRDEWADMHSCHWRWIGRHVHISLLMGGPTCIVVIRDEWADIKIPPLQMDGPMSIVLIRDGWADMHNSH